MKPNRRQYIENKDYSCKCGCGNKIIVIKRFHKSEGVPRYISGHNKPWNKGLTKKTSETVRKNTEQSGKTRRGRPISDEHYTALSKGSQERWSRDEEKERISTMFSGKGNPFHGNTHKEASLEKMSTAKKDVPLSDGHCESISNGLKKHYKDNESHLIGTIQSKETCKKKSASLKKYYEENENHMVGNIPWNTGLTKDDSEVLKEMGQKSSKTKKEFFQTPEGILHKEQMSKERLAFYQTEEGKQTRQRISKSVSDYLIAQENCDNKKYKKGMYNSIKGGIIKHDSSYEIQAFKILDELPNVLSYKRCNFYIKYMFGIIRRYHPDIMVEYTNGQKEMIEVKPIYKINTEKCRAQFRAGLNYCKERGIKFTVWTEHKLFSTT